ncbi:MAG: Clp protease N-terminal domain-containing protein [Solirubrobacteraceae bacterium]
MTPRTKKTAAALSGALVMASGAYALGTQTGDGTALAGGKTTSSAGPQAGAPPGRPGGPRDLSGPAAKLGVTEAKLRAALQDLRPDRGARKDEHQAALAKALATELGVDEAKVTAALDQLHGDRLQRFDNALAAKLGIDAAKARAAFDALKPAPGAGPGPGAKPALGDLATKLGVSEDKLRSALADLRPGPRPGGPGKGFGKGFGKRAGGPGGPGGGALAKELGVTPAKLRAAMQKIRGDLDKQHQAERDAFVTKLAAKLGVSEAKVKDVIGSEPHHGRRGP